MTVSLGSYVSARIPPLLRELLSARGCLLLPLRPDPLLLHPGLWVGRPRLERPASSFMKCKPVVWVELLPFRLPSHQMHVSLRLHYSGRAEAEVEKAAERD